MELTKVEIELINEKRANDLDLKEASAIASAENVVAKYMLEYAKRLDVHQKFVSQLNDASMSKGCGTRLFDLVVTEFEHSEIPFFYDNDSNQVKLDPINYTGRRFSIKFLGETVESEHSYYIDEEGDERIDYRNEQKDSYKKNIQYSISVDEHTTGYGFGSKNYGFKMTVNGLLNGARRDNGKNITNPKTVLSKIKDDIDMRKIIIKAEKLKDSLKERAIKEAKAFFPNAKISEYEGKITATFENGTSIEVRYYDADDKIGVKFTTNKVSVYGIDPIALGNMLQTLVKK
jgi:hypothetical protein